MSSGLKVLNTMLIKTLDTDIKGQLFGCDNDSADYHSQKAVFRYQCPVFLLTSCLLPLVRALVTL